MRVITASGTPGFRNELRLANDPLLGYRFQSSGTISVVTVIQQIQDAWVLQVDLRSAQQEIPDRLKILIGDSGCCGMFGNDKERRTISPPLKPTFVSVEMDSLRNHFPPVLIPEI